MAATEKTVNYDLPIFVDDDQPTILGDFNSAMTKIDKAIKETSDAGVINNTNIVNLTTRVTNDEEANERAHTEIKQSVTQLTERVQTDETNNAEAIQEVTEQLATKAPKVHASETNEYGLGTATEYGHVKLTDVISESGADAGTAATPKAVNDLKATVTELDEGLDSAEADIATLQGVTRSLVLFDAANKPSASSPFLGGMAAEWEESDDVTLNSAIPDWANWLDVFISVNDSYFKEGATKYTDIVTYMLPANVQTFPLNEHYVDNGTFKTRRVNRFSLFADTMDVRNNGMMAFGGGRVPFMINGNILTQKGMGLAKPTDDVVSAPFTNGLLGYSVVYSPNEVTPKLNNIASDFFIVKIVARA